jgi:carbon starvation protein
MSAIFIAVFCLLAFFLSYRFYAKFLGRKILSLDPSLVTPSHEFEDGLDFVPTRRSVLFGHHFASIAGLGPILGPAIGVIWGWIPALLWVVLGTIFLGAVHDFSALAVSLKNQGRSIGDIANDVIGPRARILFQLIIFFLLSMAMGVFVLIIARLFTELYPQAVIPVGSLLFIALLIGYLTYRLHYSFYKSSLLGIVLMFLMLWIGVKFPVTGISTTNWMLLLLFYAFLASVLPVWLLLQPRDYLNSYQLYLILILMYLGLFFSNPKIVAPGINHVSKDLPLIFPFLFVTIACGAISGFHNLVSSGTTVRQLDRASDARAIGYGGMLAEGILAAIVILACTAGVSSREAWYGHYASWQTASGLIPKLDAFISGGGNFLIALRIPPDMARAFIAVVAVGFALTTLDSATRLLRYNIEDIGKTLSVATMQNRYVASIGAVVAIGYFAMMKVNGQPAGIILWQLFGTTNQLLAGLGLLTVSIYLYRVKKPVLYTLIPMAFMLVVTIVAMAIKIGEFWRGRQWPLLVMGLIIMGMSLWLGVEALTHYKGKGMGELGVPAPVKGTSEAGEIGG